MVSNFGKKCMSSPFIFKIDEFREKKKQILEKIEKSLKE